MKNCVYVNVTVFGMSMSQKSRERKAPRIDTSAAGGSPAFLSPLVPDLGSLDFGASTAGALAAANLYPQKSKSSACSGSIGHCTERQWKPAVRS